MLLFLRQQKIKETIIFSIFDWWAHRASIFIKRHAYFFIQLKKIIIVFVLTKCKSRLTKFTSRAEGGL